MVISYLDTSAAMKLLVTEPESERLVGELTHSADRRTVAASWLLHTELHCAAGRHPGRIRPEKVGAVLDTVLLVDLTRGDLLTAASLPGRLRSQDAIHLAVALRVGADEMITYDDELQVAAEAAGIAVRRPS